MRISTVTSLVSAAVLLLVSCRKDPEPVDESQPAPHVLEMRFDPTANGSAVSFGTKAYTNPPGDSLSVTMFVYYVSGIRLVRDDGFVYAEHESYHLVRHETGKNRFELGGVPEGTYHKIEFIIGVDSLRNVSGAQTGDLDPAHGMFWDWNTGYIFYKLEGRYRDNTMSERQDYAIHVGGFSGASNCIRKCALSLPANLVVKAGSRSRIVLRAAVEEVFVTPNTLSFHDYYASLPSGDPLFQALADNYSNMFSVAEVVNGL